MAAVIAVAALWIAFAATHIWLSSLGLRPRLVERLGERGFQGLFSVVALAIFVPLCAVYAQHKHAGAFLWYLAPNPVARWTAYGLMALALALLVGGFFTPSPAQSGKDVAEPRGVLRVTRHPVLMAFAVYGVAHLLIARVNAAELVFFAGFPLFVVAGAHHQDRRKLATRGEPFRRFHAATGFLPFSRPGALRGLREAALPVALGVALAAAVRLVHPAIFGGAGQY